jgi:hypothetical protein
MEVFEGGGLRMANQKTNQARERKKILTAKNAKDTKKFLCVCAFYAVGRSPVKHHCVSIDLY